MRYKHMVRLTLGAMIVVLLTAGCDSTTRVNDGDPPLPAVRWITVIEPQGGADSFDRSEIIRVAQTYPTLTATIEGTQTIAADSAASYLRGQSQDEAIAADIASPYHTFGFSDADHAAQFQELIATYEGVAAAVGPNGPKLGSAIWSLPDPSIDDLRSGWWQEVNAAPPER